MASVSRSCADIQVNVPDASQHPLDRYLFGQAANLRTPDLWSIGGLGLLAIVVLALAWKELKLFAFDPDYAASLGLPVRGLDLLLTTLTVIAVVIGLKAVGVVLMTALLVAPGAGATVDEPAWADGDPRGYIRRTGRRRWHRDRAPSRLAHAVPTGPTIVLLATTFVVFSLFFGPARGLVWSIRRTPKPEAT